MFPCQVAHRQVVVVAEAPVFVAKAILRSHVPIIVHVVVAVPDVGRHPGRRFIPPMALEDFTEIGRDVPVHLEFVAVVEESTERFSVERIQTCRRPEVMVVILPEDICVEMVHYVPGICFGHNHVRFLRRYVPKRNEHTLESGSGFSWGERSAIDLLHLLNLPRTVGSWFRHLCLQ